MNEVRVAYGPASRRTFENGMVTYLALDVLDEMVAGYYQTPEGGDDIVGIVHAVQAERRPEPVLVESTGTGVIRYYPTPNPSTQWGYEYVHVYRRPR